MLVNHLHVEHLSGGSKYVGTGFTELGNVGANGLPGLDHLGVVLGLAVLEQVWRGLLPWLSVVHEL